MGHLELKDVLQLAVLIFYGGATWQTLKELGRRVEALEKQMPGFEVVRNEHNFVKQQHASCIGELSK